MPSFPLTITLRHRVTTGTDNTRLQIWVYEVPDTDVPIPSEIFLHQEVPYTSELTYSEKFVRTATYSDMMNYRAVQADDRLFYRKQGVDLLCSSDSEAGIKLTEIRSAVDSLVNEVKEVVEATPAVTSFTLSSYGTLGVTSYTSPTYGSMRADYGPSISVSGYGAVTYPFTVSRSVSSADSAYIKREEFVSVASPEDLQTLGSTPTVTGYYLAPTASFIFSNVTQFNTFNSTLTTDFISMGQALQNLPDGVDYTAGVTAVTTVYPIFGD